jgi:hypothetical protein
LKIKLLIFLYFALLSRCPAQVRDSNYDIDTVYIESANKPATDTIRFKALTPAEKPVYTDRTFKEDFKENYRDSDFDYHEEKQLAEEQSLLARALAWLMRVLSGGYNSNADGTVSGFGFLYYAVAIIIVLAVAYFIARSQGVWIFGKSSGKIAVYDAAAENIHEMDFASLIEQTRLAGNYRLAVRYYYLWLLKKLSFKDVISWHADKTNSDYQYEIKDPALKRDFEYLSYVYDHSWYGEFPIDSAAFGKAEKAFRKTIDTL